ncbi:hypothetical protein Pla163_36780 [Planctomycetes bacterium Pla163]|uniref:Uncharacterized protein n=1 Tax=Rohdeia mirabilis TaxID=2528008 RepID=A0A518D4X1_9BACT|nr:hypothetical protein Pla163_36780 [Planctomycetes bacterium Pla163]
MPCHPPLASRTTRFVVLALLAAVGFTSCCSSGGSERVHGDDDVQHEPDVRPPVEITGSYGDAVEPDAAMQAGLDLLVGFANEQARFVEDYTQRPFETAPVLLVPSEDGWEELLGENFPDARDLSYLVVDTFAFVDLERARIVVSPYLLSFNFIFDPDHEELRERARLNAGMLVPSLVNWHDEDHFGSLSKVLAAYAADDRAAAGSRTYLVRGHATLVECAWAESVGLDALKREEAGISYFDAFAGQRPNSPSAVGRNYLKKVLLAEGRAGVDERLAKDPPPPLLMITIKGGSNPDDADDE